MITYIDNFNMPMGHYINIYLIHNIITHHLDTESGFTFKTEIVFKNE